MLTLTVEVDAGFLVWLVLQGRKCTCVRILRGIEILYRLRRFRQMAAKWPTIGVIVTTCNFVERNSFPRKDDLKAGKEEEMLSVLI